MEYRVRVYEEEKIQDISLTGRDRLSVGSGREDDCRIESGDGCIMAAHLLLYIRNGKWFAESPDKTVVRTEREIKDGDIFILNQEKKIAVSVFEKSMGSTQSLDMAEREKTVIGRGAQCDLILKGNNISRQHAVITWDGASYLLADNQSLNGTFLNGRRIREPEALKEGDLIAVGSFDIRFRQGVLTVCDAEEEEVTERQSGYPHWFSCAPRLRRELPEDVIEIQNPPQAASAPESSVMQTIASPVVMAIVMICMVGLSVMSPSMLLFTIPMSLVTVTLSISSQKKQKRKYQERITEREKQYNIWLDGVEKEIRTLKSRQLVAMQLENPSPSECLGLLETRDARLWNRCASDSDFMSLRLGVGEGNISFTVKGQQKGFTMEQDPLLERAKEIEAKAQTIQDIPLVCDVRTERLVGIIGEREAAVRLAENMIIQATAHHSYEELKLVVVYSGKEARRWEWVKWLPHCFDGNRERRYISSTGKGADALLKELEEVFKTRSMADKEEVVCAPYYLFVFTEMAYAENQSIMKYLLNEEDIGAGAIFLYDEMHRLPKECNAMIEVKHGSGMMIQKRDMNRKQRFRIDSFGETYCERFARNMAPVQLLGSGAGSALPACVTFLEGYGVHTPQELHAEQRWASSAVYESMAVPIGVKADGDAFLFDIHEKKYGPHGLVAGMTGSGKSEMVQSWILSMALKFSPADVSFVLIDFKGTGLLLPFADLPHLAGTISDLDNKIQRNLIALENELSRRKELLDRYGVKNINDYLKLQRAGGAQEQLSYLFLVIDEFAEFKIQFPDFMTVTDRIFAIGRTLGVFAVLLTQKPAGVVDDKMYANTRFRWCLKVASVSDSREMLHHGDAAGITVPGRAYIQVGEDEIYELIQSYYSGAVYRPDLENQSTAGQRVAVVEENGHRTYYENEEKEQAFVSERTEISEIVSYLKETAKRSKSQSAKQIWLPRLADRICLEEIQNSAYQNGIWQEQEEEGLRPVVGLIDDPAAQSQYPLTFDFTKDGHMAVFGAPGTGKTTLLQTVILSMIKTYSPEVVNLYLMDFGSWSLGIFREFPHVGGVANDNEDEKIEKLVQLLERKLKERKEKFSKAGVGSLQAYRQETGEKMPYIVLVLDNFAPVLQLYPELDGFFIRFTREGGSYGMYFLVTAGNTMTLGFRIHQNIKMAVALNLSDRSDYQSIVGKTGGLEPENKDGRGLVKGNPPLEFQTALPEGGAGEGERTAYIRSLAGQMSREWKGKKAAPIPLLPDRIPYGMALGEGITLGLSAQYVEPVCLAQTRAHYLPVVGMCGSGKSNMMQVLAKQSLGQEKVQIAYLDTQCMAGELAGEDRCRYMTEAGAFDTYMKELVPLLQERKNRHDQNKDAGFDPIAIFVDGYKQAFDQLEEQTIKRMEAVIRLGKGLEVYLYIAEDADVFSRLCGQGEAVCMLMARENTAVLLGGSLISYPVFHAEQSGPQKKQALGQWEGYLLEQGNVTRFKAMAKD